MCFVGRGGGCDPSIHCLPLLVLQVAGKYGKNDGPRAPGRKKFDMVMIWKLNMFQLYKQLEAHQSMRCNRSKKFVMLPDFLLLLLP